jgi:glycosyltransferase involved in cell wall biosynthesis
MADTTSQPTRVSIVIPNYNYAKTLGLCLASVREQTHQPYEIIVVDDGSTDDSVAVAQSFGARVLRTGGNYGPPAARNVGAEQAGGDVLLFVDSDVALEPDATRIALEMLGADPRIGAICGTFRPEPLIPDGLIEEYRCLQLAYAMGGEGPISTSYTAILAIRTEVFREIGGFNAALRHTENADFGHRLSQRYQVILTQKVRGVHDHDDTLRVLVTKFFTRARLHVPLYLRKPEFEGGLASDAKGWGAIAALFALLTLPTLLLGPWWAALPAGLAVASVACDLGMYRFVRRERGLLFTCYYTAVHYLVNVTVATAIGVGTVQWLFSGEFRGLYRDLPQRETAGAAA